MAVVSRTNIVGIVSILIRDLCDQAKVKLRAFCTAKVIESGLATKTFPHEFNFDSTSVFRKSVTKLKTLFYRNILKSLPYVNFTSKEFIYVMDKDYIGVNVYSTDSMTVLSPEMLRKYSEKFHSDGCIYTVVSGITYREWYETEHLPKWAIRYCRYLNYIFRKNHLPVKISPEMLLKYDESDYTIARNSPSGAVRRGAPISHHLELKFRIQMAYWYHDSVANRQTYASAVESGNPPDQIFTESARWVAALWPHSRKDLQYYRFSPEKIFFHLDKVMKIFGTLTRKAKYGSSAFTFRTADIT